MNRVSFAGFWYLIDDDGNAISNGYHEIKETVGPAMGEFEAFLGNDRTIINNYDPTPGRR